MVLYALAILMLISLCALCSLRRFLSFATATYQTGAPYVKIGINAPLYIVLSGTYVVCTYTLTHSHTCIHMYVCSVYRHTHTHTHTHTCVVCVLFFLSVVYSPHAPLPSVILYALPDHLNTVLLVTYRIYILYVWLSCSYVT
jgi:uncharacterized membrane protein